MVRNRRNNRPTFWNQLFLAPVRDLDGLVTHHVGIQTDVTERMEAEAALRDAKEAAEAATRLKSQFLSTVSHELRTPLTAIIGYSHLMLEESESLAPEQADDVGKIARSADHLLLLVNNVLDLGQLEHGRVLVDQSAVDLAATLAHVRAQVELAAERKGIELTVHVPAGLTAWADPLRVRQILINLAANAVKFTDIGGVAIGARAVGDAVEIAVEGTGIGIPAAARDYIFDAFRQVDGSVTRRVGGTGLGLAIAKEMAELMGGRIANVSAEAEGEGSTFTLHLPAVPAPAPVSPPADSTPTPTPTPGLPRGAKALAGVRRA